MYYEACACWSSFALDNFQKVAQYTIDMRARGLVPFGPVRKLYVSPSEEVCTKFRDKYKDDFKLNCINDGAVYYRKIRD